MKKREPGPSELWLSRETLLALEPASLRQADGGATTAKAVSPVCMTNGKNC